MTFDWSEYLNLDKKLASEATTFAHREAELRGSIHLACYAAFNLVKKIYKISYGNLFLQQLMLIDMFANSLSLDAIQHINQ